MQGKKRQIKIGEKFNRLTVIKEVDGYRTPKGVPMRQALYKCDCGNEKIILIYSVRHGKTKSCGCYSKERRQAIRFLHGMTDDKIYKVWASIKQRCLNKNNKAYKNYGGRGIKICKRWMKFENFFEDMGSGYKEGLTIERKNNNGNYCKNNCLWIKDSLQHKNTRKNVFITYKGKTMIASDWEKHFGFKSDYIASYIRKGLTLNQILKRKKYERIKVSTAS